MGDSGAEDLPADDPTDRSDRPGKELAPSGDADVLRQGAPWRGPLAPRELVVLALLSAGYGPDQLPGLLRTSPEAVSGHLTSATARLGSTTWREAVLEARRLGLID